MFQLFLRARSHNYFKARSAGRDAETDRLRLAPVFEALDDAIHAAETEQSGLTRRVADVLARAAVAVGNGTDEYLTREAVDDRYLDQLDVEISNGQQRLTELSTNIAHFKFLKDALMTRFLNFKPSSELH